MGTPRRTRRASRPRRHRPRHTPSQLVARTMELRRLTTHRPDRRATPTGQTRHTWRRRIGFPTITRPVVIVDFVSMKSKARDRLITTMQDLLTRQGLARTGLNQLVAISGSPKGSIYHYFPEGKNQIAAEALMRSGEEAAAATDEAFGIHKTPLMALRAVIDWLEETLKSSDYRYGCPIATTTLEAASESPQIQQACAAAYDTWLTSIRNGLSAATEHPIQTDRIAHVALASIEGALILSRAQRSTTPLRHISDALPALLHIEPQPNERPA